MQGNKSNFQNKFHELQGLMAKSIGVKVQELTKVQQTVIFIHAVNQQFGLECVNKNQEVTKYPSNWAEQSEGVYRFNYRIKQKQSENKIVQFRLVNNQTDDGSVSVNYSIQNSQQLHQYQAKFQKQRIQENFKSYLKNLEQKLKPKKQSTQSNSNSQYGNLQPQWKTPIITPNRQPQPLMMPNRGGHYNGPFTGGQYIGPDNEIFRGRGQGNVFDPLNQTPYNINDPRRPIGSRFDPIDPFGSMGMDQRPRGGRDFQGFDSFGRPIGGGSQGGFNPGRFF